MGKRTIAFGLMVLTAAASMPTPAVAADPAIHPVQIGEETVRYQQGVPTIDMRMRQGAVQIQPLPMDHGSLAFVVAVFNDGARSAQIDIGNITVQTENQALEVFTVDRLVGKAKNRAMWSQIGLVALGGLAAGAAASQRDHYYGRSHTPVGTFHHHFSAPSVAGQF